MGLFTLIADMVLKYQSNERHWAVVVAQLEAQLPLKPEIHGSNLAIGKFYLLTSVSKGHHLPLQNRN